MNPTEIIDAHRGDQSRAEWLATCLEAVHEAIVTKGGLHELNGNPAARHEGRRSVADRTWRNLGAREGLYVVVHSDHGGTIRVATTEDASRLVVILNSLEEASAEQRKPAARLILDRQKHGNLALALNPGQCVVIDPDGPGRCQVTMLGYFGWKGARLAFKAAPHVCMVRGEAPARAAKPRASGVFWGLLTPILRGTRLTVYDALEKLGAHRLCISRDELHDALAADGFAACMSCGRWCGPGECECGGLPAVPESEALDEHLCPECGKPCLWDEGDPGDRQQPPIAARWFCPSCGVELSDAVPVPVAEAADAVDCGDAAELMAEVDLRR